MRRLAALLATGALLAGCAAASANHAPRLATLAVTHPTKLLVVMEENHTFAASKPGLPYLWSLANKYGYATHYTALSHPSLPNYLALSGGSTYGITDDGGPSKHPISGSSVFDQAVAKGKTTHLYAESQPSNCYPNNALPYVVRHTAWPYFASGKTNCQKFDTNSTGFLAAAKANALANITWLIPNLNDDAHDGTLAQADAYLKTNLAPVLTSTDFASGKLAVVITFDEGSSSNQTVETVVLDVGLSGKVVTTALTHYSLSRWMSETVGAAPLLKAATAPDMRAAFGL